MVSRADEGGGRSNKKSEEEENTSHGEDVVCLCEVRFDQAQLRLAVRACSNIYVESLRQLE
jgi:hypothetical protein